ncbi:MAG TPA: type III toxin-antitoxin system ToxN/AbiQ family toxin [Acetivibrio sp.]|nr:type III toxin-antitoxin system ToxN/AbiQ family toxin [Acetivibrio sp.]
MSRWVLPPAILLGGYMNNLHLYKIDLEYIKFLHNNYDNRVQYNSAKGKEYNENRPYVGVLVDINGCQYFAPLEHPLRLQLKFLYYMI